VSPQFTVRVADLEDGPRTIVWELPVSWFAEALEGTEASARTAGRAEVTLSLNGREVLVRGRVVAPLSMPCVVTLDPVPVEVDTEVLLLLLPSVPPRVGRRPRARQDGTTPRGEAGRGKDTRRQRPERTVREGPKGWESDPTLSETDAAQDTYDGETVVLDGFFREAVLLELPMAPRRSDLPSPADEASSHRPAATGSAAEPSLDPRLKPLAAIASRLRKNKE
jgi:uncharacterized protein